MKATIYITADWNKWNKKFEFHARGYAPRDGSGDYLIEAREIEFDTPNDVRLRSKLATALKLKKNKILAAAHVEGIALDEEIQELLALEDKSNSNSHVDDAIPF